MPQGQFKRSQGRSWGLRAPVRAESGVFQGVAKVFRGVPEGLRSGPEVLRNASMNLKGV